MKQWPRSEEPTPNTVSGLQITRKPGPQKFWRGLRGLRPASALPAHCRLPELLFVVKCHSSHRKSALSLSRGSLLMSSKLRKNRTGTQEEGIAWVRQRLLQKIRGNRRQEGAKGWYHSHVGVGCYEGTTEAAVVRGFCRLRDMGIPDK